MLYLPPTLDRHSDYMLRALQDTQIEATGALCVVYIMTFTVQYRSNLDIHRTEVVL